jgi:VanZ family protein
MKISFKKFIPGIAWFFIVLIIMCLPGTDIPEIEWLSGINFDKLVHIGTFGLLVILFCWPFYNSTFNNKERLQYFIKIAFAVSVWGLTTEFIQKYFISGRAFDLMDWAADSFGALIAYLFCKKVLLKQNNQET